MPRPTSARSITSGIPNSSVPIGYPKPTISGGDPSSILVTESWRYFFGQLASGVSLDPGTVSGLPPAGKVSLGQRAFVTDATVMTFGSIVVGGGTNAVPVYSDQVNWRIG